MKGGTRLFITVLAMVAILATGGAVAVAHGQGKGHRNADPVTGTFNLVLLNSTDGLPHWGQQITFDVTSTATYGFVGVMCYQSDVWVYGNNIAFHTGWPSQPFYLQSTVWTGGAADCNAVLYSSNSDGSDPQALATTSFHVEA